MTITIDLDTGLAAGLLRIQMLARLQAQVNKLDQTALGALVSIDAYDVQVIELANNAPAIGERR